MNYTFKVFDGEKYIGTLTKDIGHPNGPTAVASIIETSFSDPDFITDEKFDQGIVVLYIPGMDYGIIIPFKLATKINFARMNFFDPINMFRE